MSDNFHLHRFEVFFTGLVHSTLNSPRCLMRFIGEKRTLITHLLSNLVPEIATLWRCLIPVNFHLLDGKCAMVLKCHFSSH